MVYDGQALTVTGSVALTVENAGADDTSVPFDVVVFEDTNLNASWDQGIDNQLAQIQIAYSIPGGESRGLTVPLSGQVQFSGNVVWVVVDSANAIAETDESNNFIRSSSRVEVQVGGFDPVVEWNKSSLSVNSSSNQVVMTPAVADLNQDGIPDIVFSTFVNDVYHSNGTLRAISGSDGSELWSIEDRSLDTEPCGAIAVGDIDGDGLLEVIAPHESNALMAFEHDGTFKWKSPVLSTVNAWRATSIVDLDGDSVPEIVNSATVLNHDGTIRWSDAAREGNGGVRMSIAADLDLDGFSEVVLGNAAYRYDGQLYWDASLPDGYPAVGNFDEDPFPEVVLVAPGNVYVLEHDGQIKWGPVGIPGGTTYKNGGPPTVADMDGDGQPEIGVAGRYRYVVFETDGSVKWTRNTTDASSGKTGSSVFDFDGDGTAEVVYADEYYLRVYSGDDGEVVFQTANSSATAHEYPLIVDVDADGHAEIVVAANNFHHGSQTGIYVIGDANDTWVPTRQIWNQHAYHITNVNDDGTIPTHEQNSWDVHNTYRLNTLPDPLIAPDLTASFLRASGNELNANLTARIGNGGELSVVAGVPVAFYDDDPQNGGTLLGATVTTTRLDPGTIRGRFDYRAADDCCRS